MKSLKQSLALLILLTALSVSAKADGWIGPGQPPPPPPPPPAGQASSASTEEDEGYWASLLAWLGLDEGSKT